MTRREEAWKVIGQVHASLPADATFKDRKAALKAAYPFGEREYWPYKAWCKAQREYLRRYDPRHPTPPSARELMAARGDIVFPFAGEPA